MRPDVSEALKEQGLTDYGSFLPKKRIGVNLERTIFGRNECNMELDRKIFVALAALLPQSDKATRFKISLLHSDDHDPRQFCRKRVLASLLKVFRRGNIYSPMKDERS